MDVPVASSTESVAGGSFEAFYRERFPAALRLAYALSGSRPAGEDLAQDAFLAIRSRFDSLENPWAYLRSSIARLSIDRHRRQRRMIELLPKLYSDVVLAGPDRDVLDAIAGLPHRQRVVVVLRYWGDLSYAEIAVTLDCRLGTAKSLGSRALTTLRKELPQ